jgi:transposase
VAKVRSWAGLDVHAAKVVAVTVDSESGELSVHRLPGQTAQVVAFCEALPRPTRVAYEAGPTGFGLARALVAAGTECVVAAPGKIERPAQDRVKTDRRDAERLVRLLMIGGLHPVRVPSGEEEALRDLVRAREDVRGDLMRARQPFGKLLLRHDVRYQETAGAWTARHRAWLTNVELSEARRRRCWTTSARSTRCSCAATRSRAILSGSSPTRPGHRRSPDCAACAASTRSARSDCARRSATGSASTGPAA